MSKCERKARRTVSQKRENEVSLHTHTPTRDRLFLFNHDFFWRFLKVLRKSSEKEIKSLINKNENRVMRRDVCFWIMKHEILLFFRTLFNKKGGGGGEKET
jgi:hypothetical protein